MTGAGPLVVVFIGRMAQPQTTSALGSSRLEWYTWRQGRVASALSAHAAHHGVRVNAAATPFLLTASESCECKAARGVLKNHQTLQGTKANQETQLMRSII